jgi:hypothetical protein
MLCEELVSRRLFVELEGSIDQQVVRDQPIVRGSAEYAATFILPQRLASLTQFMNSLTPLRIIPSSFSFHSSTDGNAISSFR